MLVQLALIVFGLFGILAAIVDMGFVRLTQVEMQVAADAAAVEGLRARDAVSMVDPTTGQLQIDGFASDCMRRLAARDFVRWTFDDDLNPNNPNDPQRPVGAGPNVKFTGGTDTLNGYQFMSVLPEDEGGRVYKPVLQSNQAENKSYGDMVSGEFIANAEPIMRDRRFDPQGQLIDVPPESIPNQFEYGRIDSTTYPEYYRTDFVRVPPPAMSDPTPCPADDDATLTSTVPWSAPYSGESPLTDGAFLVRIRRTPNLGGLDEEPYVSSNSPTTLPLLFARGTLIKDNGDNGDPDGYQPRRDGITIRAAAIANAKPAVRIGFDPDPLNPTLRRITKTFYNTLRDSGPQDTTVGSADIAFVMPSDTLRSIAIGDRATDLMPNPVVNCNPQPSTSLSAVVDTVEGTEVVVGFAALSISWPNCTTDPSSPAIHVALARTAAPFVAPGNATASLDDLTWSKLQDPVTTMPTALMDAVVMFENQPSAVLAPILVR